MNGFILEYQWQHFVRMSRIVELKICQILIIKFCLYICRAIKFNSLVSHIRGYVGLPLGVLILQVPPLTVQLYGNVMKLRMIKTRHSITPFSDIKATKNGKSRFESRLFLRTYETSTKTTIKGKVPTLKNENDAADILHNIVLQFIFCTSNLSICRHTVI